VARLWPDGPRSGPLMITTSRGRAKLSWDYSMRAGEGNRTLMTSLEGWGSAIELRPRCGSAARCSVPGSR
jgi:hypothetical protein